MKKNLIRECTKCMKCITFYYNPYIFFHEGANLKTHTLRTLHTLLHDKKVGNTV
jgi:hypothetical protein